MLIRPATRAHRTGVLGSARWDGHRPRHGDVVVATYPKRGTAWMRRIMGLLVLQTPEPRPLMEISPWVDRRSAKPAGAMFARPGCARWVAADRLETGEPRSAAG